LSADPQHNLSQQWLNVFGGISMIRKLTALPILIFALSLSSPSANAAAAEAITPEIRTSLEKLRELITGGDLDAALSRARLEASKIGLTPREAYFLQALIASVLVNLQNYSEAATALDAALATGQVPAADVPNQIKAIAALHYNASEFQKSIDAGERFFSAKKTKKDVQILVMIAQAHFHLKRYAESVEHIRNAITEADTIGEEVDKRWVLLWIGADHKTGNVRGVAAALKEFGNRFPDSNYRYEWGRFPLLRDLPPVSL
jgi:tetratricopeptide (TPR) repeat protein